MQRRRADQGQRVHVGRQREVHRRQRSVARGRRGIDQLVGRVVDDEGVAAGTAGQRVHATVGDERVRVAVGGASDCGGAGQHQRVDVGGERERERRLDRVAVGGVRVADLVARVAHHEEVVARSGNQRVQARVAYQGVGRGVARAAQCGRTGEDEFVHVRGKDEVDRGLDLVDRTAKRIDDLVEGAVDDEGRVAGSANQRRNAAARHQGVCPGASRDRISACIALADHRGRAGQHKRVHVSRQREADRRKQHVRRRRRRAAHRIGGVVDDEDIVASTANERVGGAACHERVVTGARIQGVRAPARDERIVGTVGTARDVGRTREHQRVHVGRQREVDGRIHDIVMAGRARDHAVGRAVHHEGVVARTRNQGRRTRAGDQSVVARSAVQGVQAHVADQHVGVLVGGAHQVARARQHQVVHGRRQRVADGRLDRVRHRLAAVVGIADHVARAVDDEKIGALPAQELRRARAGGQRVVAGVGADGVSIGIARGRDARQAREREHAHRRLHRVAHRRDDRVEPCRRQVLDHVRGAVDLEDIRARAADQCRGVGAGDQRVGAAARIERVVTGVADDDVVAGNRGAHEAGRAGEQQRVDIRGQREIDRRRNSVDAVRTGQADDVQGTVDHEQVIARTRHQRRSPRAGHERVLPRRRDEGVVAGVAGNFVVAVVRRRIDC